ncbi:MAG: hypothetical protein ACRCZ2_03155 [Fusobacteriaceae bacterium]
MKRKTEGFSIVEVVAGVAILVLIFQIIDPILRSSFQTLRTVQEKSLGMSGDRFLETIGIYSDSTLGGKLMLIETTSTLSNRDIDLDRIEAKGDKGNGIYLEVSSLCENRGIWKKSTKGHIFRFMENSNQGKHIRYIPVDNLKGGKEEIISSDVLTGYFFKRDGEIFIYLKKNRGKAIESRVNSI